MSEILTSSDFNFTFQEKAYKGKVRDVYYLKKNIVVMVASDRISAFDVVMPRGIPVSYTHLTLPTICSV